MNQTKKKWMKKKIKKRKIKSEVRGNGECQKKDIYREGVLDTEIEMWKGK